MEAGGTDDHLLLLLFYSVLGITEIARTETAIEVQ